MKKNDVLKIYQKVLKEYGLGCSLDEVDIILRALGITIEQEAEQLEPDESCNVGVLKVSKKIRKGKTGTNVLNGVEREWTSSDKEVVTIKAKKSFGDKLQKDI